MKMKHLSKCIRDVPNYYRSSSILNKDWNNFFREVKQISKFSGAAHFLTSVDDSFRDIIDVISGIF